MKNERQRHGVLLDTYAFLHVQLVVVALVQIVFRLFDHQISSQVHLVDHETSTRTHQVSVLAKREQTLFLSIRRLVEHERDDLFVVRSVASEKGVQLRGY